MLKNLDLNTYICGFPVSSEGLISAPRADWRGKLHAVCCLLARLDLECAKLHLLLFSGLVATSVSMGFGRLHVCPASMLQSPGKLVATDGTSHM